MFGKKLQDERINTLECEVLALKRKVNCLTGEHDWQMRDFGVRPSPPANRICAHCGIQAKITEESRKIEIIKTAFGGE